MSTDVSSRSSTGRENRGIEAYRQLRELIVYGGLAPGAWIVEADVAQRLGVSRTPIRAALQRLNQEGYVHLAASGRQVRATVAPLTRADAQELFTIVGELEGLAARTAALLPLAVREGPVLEMRRINQALKHAAREPRPDHDRIFELDTAFHRRYVEAGAGPRLLALHNAIKPQTERYVRLYVSTLVEEIGTSVDEHDATVAAIAQGRPAAAQHAVKQNWHNATDRLSRVIEAVGERGSY